MTIDAVAGLGFPVGQAAGRFAVARGVAKLEQDLRLILLTYPGERVMRPDFGCRLRDYVFESMTPDTELRLSEEVRQALEAGEPRIVVDRVDVVPDPDVDGKVQLLIGYRLRAENEGRELAVDFRTDRATAAEVDD